MNNIYVKNNKLEELYNNLNVFIEKEKSNMRLINSISIDFAKKGLSINTVTQVFENLIEVEKLSEDELISFTISAYKYFIDEKTGEAKNDYMSYAFPYVRLLKPTLYFNDNKILENELLSPEKEQTDDYVRFEEFQQVSDNEFQGVVTFEQLAKYRKERKIAYMKEIQRAYKIVKLPNGMTVKKENYNIKGLKDLIKRFKNKDIMTTQISLTIILTKGKEPDFQFIRKQGTKITGDIVFKPIFDMSNNEYAPLCINDGAHRYNSACDVWDNAKINGKLSVMIRELTVDEAKKLSEDSFKQNSTDKMYLETLNNSLENKYANKILEMCKIWNNKIAKTTQESKLDYIVGKYSDVVDTIKILPINSKSEISAMIEAGKIGKTIDEFINYLIDKFYNSDIKLAESKGIFDKELCSSYVILGFLIKDFDVNKIDETSDIFINNLDNIKSKTNIKSIYKYLKQLVEGEK